MEDVESVTPPVGGLQAESLPENTSNGAPEDSNSIVGLLRQEFQELTDTAEVYIPVQGYEKVGLAIRYRLPANGKELELIARHAQRDHKDQYTRGLQTAINTMLFLCEGLYVKPDTVPDFVELDPQEEGEPVGFDMRLVDTLGWQGVTTPKNILLKLFANNEMAVLAHFEKLNRWLQNTKADLSREFWQTGEV